MRLRRKGGQAAHLMGALFDDAGALGATSVADDISQVVGSVANAGGQLIHDYGNTKSSAITDVVGGAALELALAAIVGIVGYKLLTS